MRKRQLGSHEDRDKVRSLLKEDHPGWVRTRLLAVKLGFDPSLSIAEISKTLGVGEASVKRWFARFRRGVFGTLEE